MGYNIGPKIGIDGENEFRNQIKNINDTYKALEAETKAVAKAFDAQGDTQGKLRAVSEQLNKQIEEQKKKQSLLQDAVQKATAKFGANSIEATRLRGALYDTTSTISDLESELNDTHKKLEAAENGMEDLGESTDDAKDAGLRFKDVFGANLIADAVLDALKSAASGAKDLAKGSLSAAADMNAMEAQFEQTFGDMQEAAEESLQNISEEVGIASTRMQGSFTKIYAFAKTAGADSAEALNLSSRATLAAADSAAYYDRSIEDTIESLQAFLKGNYANDTALGISCTETTRNAKANELYAKSFKDLTESQKVDVLLAMVEAGNKASGAFGQAARESDTWGNVLGELSEMFRQFQAEAGKPALKALTPVIKKITKAGYELIEDIDWDAFGETVEDIVDGAIEYGPKIIRLIATIAAGVAAFKVAKKVSDFVKLSKAFLGIGAAAKQAATTVQTSGAAAAASPWGLVAALIGAAVGNILASSVSLETVQTRCDKVTEKLDGMRDSMEESFSESKSSADSAYTSVERYVLELQELETAGLQTAESQAKYRDIVAQLNELMPDLNLEIDENTGLLKQNTSEILKNAEALRDKAMQDAYQERLTDSVELHAEATVELAAAQRDLNKLQEKGIQIAKDMKDPQAARKQIEKDLLEIENKLAKQEGLSLKQRDELTIQAAELQERLDFLNLSSLDQYNMLVKLKKEEDDLNKTIESTSEEVSNSTVEIAENQIALDDYTLSVQNAAIANSGLTTAQLSVKTQVEGLVAEYDAAKLAALESINTQIGLFDDLSGKSEWSKEQIVKNWQSQVTAFTAYEENLAKAVDMGLDQALVQQLSDGSVESMQILAALVTDTGLGVDDLNKEFGKVSTARDKMAGTMALMQTDAKTKWNTITADAKQAGMDVATGSAAGVRNNAWKFVQEMSNMALSGQNAFKNYFKIKSPSRWMADRSEDIIDGGVNSLKANSKRYAESFVSMADMAQRSFLQEKLDVAVSYPNMVSAATVNNTRRVTNMGGFSIHIYQQPGESAEDLAYRVMDIIQTEVSAKEAVFSA